MAISALLTRTEEPLAVRPLVSRSLPEAAPLRSGIVDRASGRRRCVVLRRSYTQLQSHRERKPDGERSGLRVSLPDVRASFVFWCWLPPRPWDGFRFREDNLD
ncbi:hypothetical protein Taro_044521 [Colocasia esculenta]|uniref:Uncharacterized protein n=1 Tax=Colocasia esculenta TaxID=4460 RepID=A0A843X2W6_COLES|nr:hypothetical protein [Colocasia esculenta]